MSGTESPRWERVQALFLQAASLEEDDREAFLARECGDDRELVTDVRALLVEDARAGSILDRGLGNVAGELVGGHTGGPDLHFGPYRVLSRIGEGGMGVVYLAERPDLGHRVAIKVLRDAALSPARRERFRTEQRTLAQLSHPSIAPLHDADSLPDGTPWFAMEYVEGLPLTEYCRVHETSIEGRLLLLRAVAQAVDHAHRHLVVHRDLKPSNVLVRPDGSVALLDFGIAKQLERPESPVDQTRTGLRLMTPAYAAPEQLRGEPVGMHTDIYSLGVILYELLTGRLPFDVRGLSPAEAERLIVEREPARPSTVPGRPVAVERSTGTVAWADLDVLCLTAMHKDPTRRYRSADALIRDLDHYLAGEPLDAQPDRLGYRLAKFVRRNRAAVTAAVAIGVTVLALVGFYTARLTAARNRAEAEAVRTQRIQRFVLDLFRGGDQEAGPADSLRVIELLDRGVREAGQLDAEPAAQAEMLATLGGIYQQLGKLERADSLLSAALAGRQTLLAPDDPLLAESELALAGLRVAQARFDDGERLARAGVERLVRIRADHPNLGRANTVLGKVLEERGDYPAAIAVLELALAQLDRRSDEPDADRGAALTELGNSHFYAGNFEIADSLFRAVLALDRRLHGPRHPLVANDLINVGAVLHERGRYGEAEDAYRDALALNRDFYGARHPKVAQNLTMLGRALLFQRELAESRDALTEAVAIQEEAFGPDYPVVASTVNELGSVALMGDRLDEAERAYRRMAGIYRAAYPDGHFAIGVAVSNLASVLLNRGDYRAAEPLFRESVMVFSETQSPDHLNTGIARIKLGRTLLRLQRFREAAEESLAGYDIVAARADPGVSWLGTARRDLVAAYEALGDSAAAARYAAELADSTGS
ncbi:MAG: tetratricopeptide repeat protein [Gemmatimonadales bacterium]